ncbi:hypothetical protein [Dactylosporangium salmoneum]
MFNLTPAGPVGPVSAGAVVDLLWLHVAAPDGIKHIHARSGPAGVDVVMFTVASDQGIADVIARTVCRRALSSTPALRGWRLL